MTSLELDVMGVAETFWKDSGEFTTTLPNSKDRFKVIFSGGEKKSKRNSHDNKEQGNREPDVLSNNT